MYFFISKNSRFEKKRCVLWCRNEIRSSINRKIFDVDSFGVTELYGDNISEVIAMFVQEINHYIDDSNGT